VRNKGETFLSYSNDHGISLNAALVAASDDAWESVAVGRDSFENIDVVAYAAVLQETLEHEIAHVKNHQTRIGNICGTLSNAPKGSPLKGETGSYVQHAIRDGFFKSENPKVILRIEAKRTTVLHPNPYRPFPVVRLDALDLEMPGDIKASSPTPNHELTIEQIKAHMAYPPEAPAFVRINDDDSDDVGGKPHARDGKRKDKDGEGSDSEGKKKPRRGSSRGSGGSKGSGDSSEGSFTVAPRGTVASFHHGATSDPVQLPFVPYKWLESRKIQNVKEWMSSKEKEFEEENARLEIQNNVDDLW